MSQIHPTATIADGAVIAKSAKIGAFCKVAKNVRIDDGVTLEPHVHIEQYVHIQENAHIYSFAKIGNGITAVTIGQNCRVREFTHVAIEGEDDTSPIIIKPNCYIMAHVKIDAGVTIEDNCTLTMNVILHKNSKCEKRVIIGAKSTIGENCTIGTGSMVGAASCVQHDMPPFTLIEGYPSASIRGLNSIGMRRNFKDRSSINSVKKIFMTLKKDSFSSEKASQLLEQTVDKHAHEFASFVSLHSCV